jgi:hypothetical protein
MELTTLYFYIFSRLEILAKMAISQIEKNWEKNPKDKFVWIDE